MMSGTQPGNSASNNVATSGQTGRQERAQGGEPQITDSSDPNLSGGNRAVIPDVRKKAKMAPQPSAPPGTEQDNCGNAIPFEQGTEDDQYFARSGHK